MEVVCWQCRWAQGTGPPRLCGAWGDVRGWTLEARRLLGSPIRRLSEAWARWGLLSRALHVVSLGCRFRRVGFHAWKLSSPRTQVPMSRMEVQGQGVAGWVSGENPLPHRWPSCHRNLHGRRGKGAFSNPLTGAQTPFVAPLSRTCHLPKAPPRNTITLGVKIST